MKALLLVPPLFLIACGKEKLANACSSRNPTQNVEWLREKVLKLSESPYCNAVVEYHYRNQTVFVIGTCEPNVNSINQIYDCEGNFVCGWGDQQCPDFEQKARMQKLLWRSN